MDVAGLILAGGRARRFGEMPKALAILGGVAMIEHVIERLSPQVFALVLGVEERNPLFNALALEQIADPEPGKKGPLAALLSGLRWLQARGDGSWLQLAPCDTPFLPTDLVGRLALHVKSQQAQGCVPRFRGQLHPACGLWNVSLIPALEQSLEEGITGFKAFLERHPMALLDWPEPHAGAPDPFFNVNTPQHLQQAERAL